MNPDLLSNTVSLALLAVVAALLLAHLSQLAGGHRLRHAVDASTCAGLIYLFGMRAFGWSALPREALCATFVLIAIGVVVMGWRRGVEDEDADFSWRLTMIQSAAMAYVFGPLSLWRPAASLVLLLFFGLETMRWLAGTEEALTEAQRASPHPPLFPPKRARGLREFALAGTAAVLAYVFAMGIARAPLTPPPESSAPAADAGAESPAQSDAEATSEATKENAEQASEGSTPESPPAAPETYTTVAGDTFKTIAKKLYGAQEKWRSLAAANPGLKPGAKFKAGVTIKLAEPRSSRSRPANGK